MMVTWKVAKNEEAQCWWPQKKGQVDIMRSKDHGVAPC